MTNLGPLPDDIDLDVSNAVRSFFDHLLGTTPFQIGVSVSCNRIASTLFNARVETQDGQAFGIYLFDGAIAVLRRAYGLDAVIAEGATETFRQFAAAVLGNAAQHEVMLRHAIHLTLMFLLLHEFAHIRCGHFRWRRDTQASGAFAFDEIAGETNGEAATPVDDVELAANLPKLFELEADAIAFQMLNEVSATLFESNEEIQELLQGRANAETAADTSLPELQTLALHASCMALCLIDGARRDAGLAGDYPLPCTRLIQLFFHYLYLTVPGWTQVAPLHLRQSLDDATWERIVHVLVDAVDIGAAACEAAGLEVPPAYDLNEDDGLITGILAMIRHPDQGAAGSTVPELLELSELRRLFRGYQDFMQRFRLPPWGEPAG